MSETLTGSAVDRLRTLEQLAEVIPILPARPPIPEPIHNVTGSDILDALHGVELLLEDGDLLAAVGHLRAARVAVARMHVYPTYGLTLPMEWFEGEGFDAELALARMAGKAAG